jgi:hypothetical protein
VNYEMNCEMNCEILMSMVMICIYDIRDYMRLMYSTPRHNICFCCRNCIYSSPIAIFCEMEDSSFLDRMIGHLRGTCKYVHVNYWCHFALNFCFIINLQSSCRLYSFFNSFGSIVQSFFAL